MEFSKAQLDAGAQRHVRRVLDESLVAFESDMRPEDAKLADDVMTYRQAGDFEIFQRIVELTNIGIYQRTLLAMTLQSGIDFTRHESFHYIIQQPALSGNTKARHIILMAHAINQSRG